ncbi:MAG: hypothetical protein JST24_01795 [Acidobacteria bacterium]|nr:hypothetical protein [Acidobacteriota bacterium]
MTTFPLRNAIFACGIATGAVLPAMAQAPFAPGSKAYLYEAERAKGVAAVEVGGEAIAARLIDLNGATGGWEVLVRMSSGNQGWRVIVDRDTWTVRSKAKVPNP